MNKQIVEAFREIVEKVEDNVLAKLQQYDANIQTVHYEHGHYAEIANTLINFDKSPDFYNKKYPLIALFEDIRETIKDDITTANLSLIICYSTKSEYKSADRYAEVIDPILEVIYDELIEQITTYPYFKGYDIPHSKIIRPYWGVEGKMGNRANIFGDFLDAIELNSLIIRYEKSFCNPTNNKTWQLLTD